MDSISTLRSSTIQLAIHLVAASSLDESIRSFQPAQPQQQQKNEVATQSTEPDVEVATEAAPARAARSARTAAPAKNAPQKGGKAGGTAAPKVNLPAAQKNAPKTPVEALAAIANNRKVAISREVGKLVAQRAKEQGVNRVVFDRGGYAYHGRIAALAEGAREAGLDF